MTRTIRAFDHEAVHAGNRGLAIDHDKVAGEVDELLSRMTLAEKLNEIRGRQVQPIDGLYHAGGSETLGLPTYRMVDGPRGARTGNATAFPVAIARAASFDVALERRVGLAIGAEVAARGGNVLLAPTINLIRHPGWGRAQEAYSEDPYLTGAMGVAFVSGAQNFVLTSPKHFAANNLEFTRFELSADMDLRTLHEVYLPHFKRCVVEGAAASIMSAYNKLNDIYCGEHPELLTHILREDWGFTGFVESDWFLGTRSTAPAINAGMDIEMPAAYRFLDEKIEEALASGEITADTITRNARHAIYQKVAWRLDELPVPDTKVVECAEHVGLAREAAEQSIVLLENRDRLLPLEDRPGLSIAVVGDLADTVNLGDRGSSMVTSSAVTTPLAGIQAICAQAAVTYFPSNADLAPLADHDLAVVITGLTYQHEGEYIPTQQQEAEGSNLARGGDRAVLTLPDTALDLIERTTRAAKKTIVVLEGGSAIEVRGWVDSVDALLMAWYPGREGGHAIANVLFGAAEPGGRLPVSFPKHLDQLMPWDTSALVIEHDLLHGYRYLDHQGHDPEYAFGHGLSYTTFSFSDLAMARRADRFEITVTLTNTGDRAGAAIAQLYVAVDGSSVPRAPRELKGFGRAPLTPGESAVMVFELSDAELCYYDMRNDSWQLEAAGYSFQVGASSRDLPLARHWQFDATSWLEG